MSYSRGELYVYEDVDKGLTCMCSAMFVCSTEMEMIEHLRDHMATAFVQYTTNAIRGKFPSDDYLMAVFTKAWLASVRLYEEINDPDLPHYTR